MPKASREQIAELAKERYGSDDITVDVSIARVSRVRDAACPGAWVQARVWVDGFEIETIGEI